MIIHILITLLLGIINALTARRAAKKGGDQA